MIKNLGFSFARTIRAGLLLVIAAGHGGCEEQSPAELGLQGVVEFDETILSFEIPGRIAERPVERGDLVTQGQLMARLDEEIDQTQKEARQDELAAARAQVDLLEAGPKNADVSALAARVSAARATERRIEENLKRERALLERGVTPAAIVDDLARDLDRASAERKSLEAQLVSLRQGARTEEIAQARSRASALASNVEFENERLRRHELRAPLAGQVLEVQAEPGETVGAGTPVVTLGDVTHPYVEVFVPQGELGGVQLGRAAQVRVDAYEQAFTGRVEHIASKTEFTPRYLFSEQERPNLVVRVRVRVDDPKRRLFAGVPAFVKWTSP